MWVSQGGNKEMRINLPKSAAGREAVTRRLPVTLSQKKILLLCVCKPPLGHVSLYLHLCCRLWGGIRLESFLCDSVRGRHSDVAVERSGLSESRLQSLQCFQPGWLHLWRGSVQKWRHQNWKRWNTRSPFYKRNCLCIPPTPTIGYSLLVHWRHFLLPYYCYFSFEMHFNL